MTHLTILKPVIFFACAALVISCQKESLSHPKLEADKLVVNQGNKIRNELQQHMFKGETKFASWLFVPGSGWVNPNPAPGWYLGEGIGNFNLLGKSYGFINMYVTYVPGVGLRGAAAPVNLFFADRLSEVGITLPNEVDTYPVSIILFDKQGNSVWAGGTNTYHITVTPPDPNTGLVKFGSTPKILGGTGKFSNATGHFVLSGYFHPQDYSIAGLEVTDGVIEY